MGRGEGTFQPPCHILHYHMVLRPEGTSNNNSSLFLQWTLGPSSGSSSPPPTPGSPGSPSVQQQCFRCVLCACAAASDLWTNWDVQTACCVRSRGNRGRAAVFCLKEPLSDASLHRPVGRSLFTRGLVPHTSREGHSENNVLSFF